MSKRSNESGILPNNSSKKLNYNLWKDEKNDVSPHETPPSLSNKYNFNIWNKSNVEIFVKPINISEVIVGIW